MCPADVPREYRRGPTKIQTRWNFINTNTNRTFKTNRMIATRFKRPFVPEQSFHSSVSRVRYNLVQYSVRNTTGVRLIISKMFGNKKAHHTNNTFEIVIYATSNFGRTQIFSCTADGFPKIAQNNITAPIDDKRSMKFSATNRVVILTTDRTRQIKYYGS